METIIDMLSKLKAAKQELPALLQDRGRWESLLIDYHKPLVKRLWTDLGEYRLYLHWIYPCEMSDALFHTHPWASAMHIVSGIYEMGIGYGEGTDAPPIAAKILLPAGSSYEMTHPNGWHYVRPIGKMAASIMITAKPWDRVSPKSSKPLHPLSEGEVREMLEFFKKHFPC